MPKFYNMKILLCLNRDVYCLLAFNCLLLQLKNHQVKIYFSNSVDKAPESKNLQILRNIEQDLSIENIGYLLDKAGVTNINLDEFLTFEKISKDYQIFDFQNINSDGVDFLTNSWKPDLIISIRFGQIFKEPIIALPNFGIINLHSGILPNYRGVMATFWSMLNGEKEIGTTLHFISDSSIDTGDIVAISKKPINYDKSYIANVLGLYENGTKNIADALYKLENNPPIVSVKQDRSLGKYFSYPSDIVIGEFLSSNGLYHVWLVMWMMKMWPLGFIRLMLLPKD